jgi:nucleotide-binding universal stress UspA family protein
MFTILSTLDGSSESEAVLPVLEKIAVATSAKVEFLTVVEPPGATPRAARGDALPDSNLQTMPGASSVVMVDRPQDPAWAETEDQALARVRDEGAAYLAEAARPLSDHGISTHVQAEIGTDAGAAIIEYARLHNVDLIAMATHGRTGLRNVLHGSVAAAVIRSGVAPVLLVPSS